MDFQQQPYGALDDAVCGEEGRKGVIDRVNLYIGSLNWEEVPDLTNMSENDSEEALGSVVKFRCMVQSVLSPEPYVPVWKD
ncbi:hypothetical protein Pmar_PMAR025276, partial [Perkinsus marinus ATCC 50983]